MHHPGEIDALFNPETSIFIQKRHPYTGNLNSETPGDSKNAFLHCGDVLAAPQFVHGTSAADTLLQWCHAQTTDIAARPPAQHIVHATRFPASRCPQADCSGGINSQHGAV